VRARFSLATEPATYEALAVAAGWLPHRAWPRFVQKSAACALLVRDLRESLTVLAKQGQTDTRIFLHLVAATGSQDEARRVATDVAQRVPGLSTDVREWLIHGQRVSSSASHARDSLASLSRDAAENVIIADLL